MLQIQYRDLPESVPQFPLMVSSDITMVPCQNEETTIATSLLAKLKTLFGFHQFLYWIFVCLGFIPGHRNALGWRTPPFPLASYNFFFLVFHDWQFEEYWSGIL